MEAENRENKKRKEDHRISLTGEDGEQMVFYVLEETMQYGINYLLVTDQKEGDGDCWILKDTSAPESTESAYEFVEDEEELDALFRIFQELMGDSDVQITE